MQKNFGCSVVMYLRAHVLMYRCEDPEESYESSEEIGKKYGIKYITSPLAIGTLVWAKMHGYCRLVAKLLELTNLPPHLPGKIKAMVECGRKPSMSVTVSDLLLRKLNSFCHE